jgi:hypothetical protein
MGCGERHCHGLAVVREDELGGLVRMAHEEEGRPVFVWPSGRATVGSMMLATRPRRPDRPSASGARSRARRHPNGAWRSGRSRNRGKRYGTTVWPRPRLRYFGANAFGPGLFATLRDALGNCGPALTIAALANLIAAFVIVWGGRSGSRLPAKPQSRVVGTLA